MNADGTNDHLFYDSGQHDADPDWKGDQFVFTRQFTIWTINPNGTQVKQVTNPPDAGKWGNANLPIGDYDPKLSPNGTKIVFERLENPYTTHGRYNFFVINSDGTEEKRLTNTSYAQGIASWSHSGLLLTYVVSAIDNQGEYDIYVMNSDGTEQRNITPDYVPTSFLCYAPTFSKIYFIGQWWS
jgi:Tol biopolymer transport system component